MLISSLTDGKFSGAFYQVLQSISRRIEHQVSRLVTKSIIQLYWFFILPSLILPNPSLLLLGILSPSNHMYISLGLRPCFRGTHIKTISVDSGPRNQTLCGILRLVNSADITRTAPLKTRQEEVKCQELKWQQVGEIP